MIQPRWTKPRKLMMWCSQRTTSRRKFWSHAKSRSIFQRQARRPIPKSRARSRWVGRCREDRESRSRTRRGPPAAGRTRGARRRHPRHFRYTLDHYVRRCKRSWWRSRPTSSDVGTRKLAGNQRFELRIVCRRIVNPPFRVFAQVCVKPRKLKVSGFPAPRLTRFCAA